MHEPPRYGIFQVGQVWRLVSGDGLELGFPDREHALAEARRLTRRHLGRGDACEVMMVDEAGRLALVPAEDGILAHAVSGSR
jgi:hypothetical protein